MAEFIVLERQFKIRQTLGDILSTVLSDNSVYIFKYTYADMAELADAPDLGSGVYDVQVQVLLSALFHKGI